MENAIGKPNTEKFHDKRYELSAYYMKLKYGLNDTFGQCTNNASEQSNHAEKHIRDMPIGDIAHHDLIRIAEIFTKRFNDANLASTNNFKVTAYAYNSSKALAEQEHGNWDEFQITNYKPDHHIISISMRNIEKKYYVNVTLNASHDSTLTYKQRINCFCNYLHGKCKYRRATWLDWDENIWLQLQRLGWTYASLRLRNGDLVHTFRIHRCQTDVLGNYDTDPPGTNGLGNDYWTNGTDLMDYVRAFPELLDPTYYIYDTYNYDNNDGNDNSDG